MENLACLDVRYFELEARLSVVHGRRRPLHNALGQRNSIESLGRVVYVHGVVGALHVHGDKCTVSSVSLSVPDELVYPDNSILGASSMPPSVMAGEDDSRILLGLCKVASSNEAF